MTKQRDDWPWYRVKAELAAKGLTLTELASRHGLERSSASKVKTVPIPRVQKIIARTLGYAPTDIWPTRYTQSGDAVPPSTWMKNTTAHDGRHVQSNRAA